MAIPLEANLDDEADEGDIVAALFRNVDAANASDTAKTMAKADVEINVPPRKTHQPDVVIEIEESERAKERGHVLIAIDNPNPDLEVKIDKRTVGNPVMAPKSAVSFQAICFILQVSLTLAPLWIIIGGQT